MGIVSVFEDLDEGLNITQVINEDLAAETLPEHDQLYLDKAKEVEDAEKTTEETPADDTPSDTEGDPEEDAEQSNDEEGSDDASEDSGDDDGEEESEVEEPDMKEINGKQTTVATESLRTDDYYSRFALESFGEETLGQGAGSAVWSGIKTLSGYALHIATELGTVLKDVGVEYGPKVFSKLRSAVSYLLTRAMRSFGKMRSAVARAYFQHANSFKSHKNRLDRLRKILDELPDNVKVMKDEPFLDQETFGLFLVGGQVSPRISMSAVERLLDVVVGDIDRGISNEINVMKSVIDVCKRNARADVVHYLRIAGLSSSFMKKDAPGFNHVPEIIESFAFTQPLPKGVVLATGVPRAEVVSEAARSGDLTEVSRAYQESYMVLGINPIVAKISPMINYMDKKSLVSLLDGLDAIIGKAATHVSFYKKLSDESESLKPSFQNYFSWLTEDEKAKSLRNSLVEVIYLKQSFITKVYLPGAIDIHDYVSTYVSGMLRYVEKNIKVLKPAEEESAV